MRQNCGAQGPGRDPCPRREDSNRITLDASDSVVGVGGGGNRLSKTVDSLLTVNYSYDANGNTTGKDDGSLTTYQYDSENRLIRAQTATETIVYSYDADGIRQSQTINGVTIAYLVGKNRDYAQVLEERDGSNTTSSPTPTTTA